MRTTPPPVTPPAVFEMEFPREEGWVIVAALQEYVARHPAAASGARWMGWAHELELLLRVDV